MLINRNCYKMVNLLTRMVRLNTLQPISRGNKYFMPYEHPAYDGPGHTTVSVLNTDSNARLLINAYSEVGFRLNNGLFVLGPSIVFPKSVFSWNVSCPEDINEESLSLFTVLEPKVDILILGFDYLFDHKKPLIENLQKMLRAKKICFEIYPLEHAISVFNFLNVEDRYVAAGLLPSFASASAARTETVKPVEQKVIEEK